ncbi:MAG TPA: DNA-3-methyladenine glycosylase I [Rhodospirillaceae bacterium]|nr:DNA-3-methyladenine glycosylase I [Alphaproteobacteria bacterium]OUT39138.1 MAG: 3-methyladenine DNA glycosylase [Micavibrio sp. TMED2]HCI45743.1 DNA-3-methyladenine glycosylase I [Rhodospirillaceae bacterium]MAS48475.1 DNA-3-methyladenine glycosylase I [Alphaproteobacteria bacterium]MAX96267.1 DNA-3-methyladenine glycosylase I [Alphaproteobacteria bacterium]|tara:strand:- start:6070 stop:6705 length:636 start_codon:yes stop_codon:yes gene_type:complete
MTEKTGLITGEDGKTRCWWPGEDAEYLRYHDEEWGRPVGDDNRLFEKLCLEGFQSGLSWITILRKRENFRAAFAGFDPVKVSKFTEADVERLLQDAGIIRHRGKIEATINNAKRALELQQEAGSIAAFIWRFEPDDADRPARLTYQAATSMGKTPASTAMSKELKKRGWKFVGPTTCYAFMQSMGLVNDHIEGCSCRAAHEAERSAFKRPT